MIRLIYISRATQPFTTAELLDLLRTCEKSNAANGLTGVLLYHNECFLQVLEGDESKINKTFELIKKDKRHREVIELERKHIDKRGFEEWSMGFQELNNDDLKKLNIKGLSDFFAPQNNTDAGFKRKLISSLMTHFSVSYQKRKSHVELPVDDDQDNILKLLHKLIRFAVTILGCLMVFVIFLGVIDVFYVIYQKLIVSEPMLVMTIEDILATFGAFLAVLIAIEIFLNISLYIRSDVVPVKLVVATALMAISRKVIVFDFKSLKAEHIYGSAAVVLALGITYWLIEKNELLKSKQD